MSTNHSFVHEQALVFEDSISSCPLWLVVRTTVYFFFFFPTCVGCILYIADMLAFLDSQLPPHLDNFLSNPSGELRFPCNHHNNVCKKMLTNAHKILRRSPSSHTNIMKYTCQHTRFSWSICHVHFVQQYPQLFFKRHSFFCILQEIVNCKIDVFYWNGTFSWYPQQNSHIFLKYS